MTSILRDRGARRQAHVTNMELFFDLVFVFAMIQLSGHLEADLSWPGVAETGVMFLALWWAWNYTAWATGWIDPEQGPVMMMLAVLMLLSLIMAASIPDAFPARADQLESAMHATVQTGVAHGAGIPAALAGATEGSSPDRGPAFAGAYVVLQLVRSGFMVWAFSRSRRVDGSTESAAMRRNYLQLLAWSAIAGIGWVAGAFVHDDLIRLLIWLAAAIVDIGAPLHGFWLPRAGATPIRDWTLAGAHLAERCELLLMIAFGETVLRLGEAFAGAREHTGVTTAFVVGFLISFALWAMYFTHHAERAAERLAAAEDEAAGIGRSGYAYAHMLMVGGVILLAVAEHLAVVKPQAKVSWAFALVLVGGPSLYLFGIAWSKRALGERRIRLPVAGAVVLALLALATSPFNRVTELIAALVLSAAFALLAARDARRGSQVRAT